MPSKPKLPPTVRNYVWNMHIGIAPGQGLCFCCKLEPITCGNFECGHIVSRSEGGDDRVQNLRPICGLCKKSVGSMSMEVFMRKYGFDVVPLCYQDDKSEKQKPT